MTQQKQYQNRLAQEQSPYLLQHADNPVDWYPWGDEAFEKARKEDKPVFLSIGYSTCHWCHVMEHESFEDPDIAKMINDYFVPVKVDREERPDLDNIYMTAVTSMTGQGGWPLTVILTHDKKPFFGGTYFPPYAKWGSPGLVDVMKSIHEAWTNNRQQLIRSSDSITEVISQNAHARGPSGELTPAVLTTAFDQLKGHYDPAHGGFGRAPKFPTSHNLSFLLRYWKRHEQAEALAMVEHTLKEMAGGGMHDHLGGGFHRYSTDQKWQVPHFEKMLYDQALLSRTYLEAYQATEDPFYANVASDIFEYVLRDLRDPAGGFYSAEDADSYDPDEFEGMTPDPSEHIKKKEGAFYVWRLGEIDAVLEKEAADIFKFYYGLKPDGNASSDPHGEFTGKNILFTEHTVKETAEHFQKDEAGIRESLRKSKQALFKTRLKRPRPHLDDKILVDWNGLMISSFALGARALNEPKYAKAAQEAADMILAKMKTKEGRLLHRYRNGHAGIAATLEDYAFIVHGLIDLYEATFEVRYLEEAVRLSHLMVDLYWDEENGGFFLTADDAKGLIFRPKEVYDGAIPSGNSIAAMDLVRILRITLDSVWEEKLQKTFAAFHAQLSQQPGAYAQMMMAFDFALGPSREIVIVTPDKNDLATALTEAVYRRFIPNKVVLLKSEGDKSLKDLVKLAPFVKEQRSLKDKTTAYVCVNHVCKLPVTDVASLEKLLEGSPSNR